MRKHIISLFKQGKTLLRNTSSHDLKKIQSEFDTPFMTLVNDYLSKLNTDIPLGKVDILKRINQRSKTNLASIHRSLPQSPDLLYRGTEGRSEINAIFRGNTLGREIKSEDVGNYNLIQFIEENKNNNFLSSTPCPYTVHSYAAGLSLIPTDGFIMVLGLPKVFTKPQKLLLLHPELFDLYDQKQIENNPLDNLKGFRSIKPLAKNNIEWTIVTRGPHGDDWRQFPSRDILKLIHVCGPGRILQSFMSSNELLHVDELVNEQFKKRVFSVEVVIGNSESDFEKMNHVGDILEVPPKCLY